MEEFKKFILSRKLIPDKKITYFQNWVLKYSSFHDFNPCITMSVDKEHIDSFSAYLEKIYEPWQVKQAQEALRLFMFIRPVRFRGQMNFPGRGINCLEKYGRRNGQGSP